MAEGHERSFRRASVFFEIVNEGMSRNQRPQTVDQPIVPVR